MASLVSHWWALVDVIGCNLHNRCDSRTFERMKLNMFNPCNPGRNRCRMYGCTCSCSCMFVYSVRSSRRSVAGPIAATIASCKHRIYYVNFMPLDVVVMFLVFMLDFMTCSAADLIYTCCDLRRMTKMRMRCSGWTCVLRWQYRQLGSSRAWLSVGSRLETKIK